MSVEFTPTAGVERVVLKYRGFGESEFREQEMLMAGNYATLTISPEVVLPPYVEYYVELRLADGRSETYPLENPQSAPLKANVKQLDPKDLEVRLLSPEQGETVAAEDLVIAVSLFYASDNVNRSATKLLLDGSDVTGQAVFSEDVIMFSAASSGRPLNLGVHFLRIELYDSQGALYHAAESNFNLSTAIAIAAQETRFRLGVDGQAEYRREDIASTVTTFTRGQLRLNGSYKSLNLGSNFLFTNEEKAERQPQNRFLLTGDLDVLKIQVGDAYPKFPSYIVSGKRVRGVSGGLYLKFFNVDVSYGETVRDIEGRLTGIDTTFADTSGVNARPENTALRTGMTYSYFNPGSFAREFLAVRPSFGSGENFQLGFTYLKSKDKIGSIKYGTRPQENLVFGTDLLLAFDNQRFRIETQAAFGLTNKNTTEGSFTQADYDKIAGKDDATLTPSERAKKQRDADDLKKIADIVDKFITINENLSPLNPIGEGIPALSYEGLLTLNYFNNFIRVQHYQRGAGYTSFGNEYLQPDINGTMISDRIRMFENRALLSVSYEMRKDNTAKSKLTTTEYTNLNTSLTLYPANNLPSFTVGYGMSTRKNDANPNDIIQKLVVADDKTNRILLQVNYDFTVGPRQNFSLGINLADKKDNTFNKRDQKNNSYFGSLTTIFTIPLQTTLSFNTNVTESAQLSASPTPVPITSTFELAVYSFNARYRLINDKMQIASTVSATTGDISRTLAQLAVEYTVTENHGLALQYDFIQNSGFNDDSIASLIYRFNF